LGERSRSELRTEFKNYKALLLLSLGEADALVLYEAQMAGLPVFVTEEGAGAQDFELSWINFMNKDTTPETIESQTNAIKVPPEKIAEYATNNYSWAKKNAPLIAEMWRLISR
jgi:glycosyltransferase involved in cell wall biosynthesis